MADYGDYFDLLARSVARFGAETAGARQRIFESARHAQALQLQNFDPRSAASLIQRELNALEEAIRRIEIVASEEPAIIEVWQTLLEPKADELAESPREDRPTLAFWRNSRIS